jgi:hypothetical protein
MKIKRASLGLIIICSLLISICLFALSDNVYQVSASTQTKTQDTHNNLNNPGSLVVTGYFQYENKDQTIVNADRFYVSIYSQANMDLSLAVSQTNSNGFFELGPIENPGQDKIAVRIWAHFEDSALNKEIQVASTLDTSFCIDCYKYDWLYSNVLPDGQWLIGTRQIPTQHDMTKASRIKSYLQQSYDFAVNNNLHRSHWSAWPYAFNNNNMYCMCNEGGCTYDEIYLKEDAYNDPDAVLHETGHLVMEEAYHGQMPLS